MKKIAYSLFAAAFVVLSGCQDDVVVEEPVVPAQTGDEITFGSSLENTGVDTRTAYGDEPVNGAYPVYWEADGSDQISIYCPEAAQGKIVNYTVKPAEDDATHSSAVTKVNPEQAGLQWGDVNQIHHFSAFYPANQIKGQKDGKLLGEIPVDQRPVAWKKTINDDGTIIYTGVANTDYAFMWAYNEHDPKQGGDVALSFKPWVTILDVEINGPENDASNGIKMSSVQLRATDYTTLTGDFVIDFTDVEQNPDDPDAAPGYEAAGSTSATRSQISIQLYANEFVNEDGSKEQFNDFITLKHGDKIVVRFYLLPKDTNYDTSTTQNLQLRVTPFNSSVLTRTLNAQGGTQSNGILAHKVNKVILPPVSQRGNNYWMSSLNPNIFVTELSLPGSKMSYQTEANGANVAYQKLPIADQIQNGIRAFQIQTASTNTGRYNMDGGSASDQVLYMTVAGTKTDTRFREIVQEIATGLKNAETEGRSNEYAFILLTASLSECEDYGRYISGSHVEGQQAWMDAIRNELEYMTQQGRNADTYRIYTDEITPSTTISDVAGHIIIKVNYNNESMASHLSESDKIPAMFAQWGTRSDIETPFTETNAYAINAMRWGTSRNADAGTLQWFYHEATTVGTEESETDKINNIEDMWRKSIEYYEDNDDHSMWFLNDLGGSYASSTGGEYPQGVNDWTAKIGPYATNLLQNRTEDATLGIVLMNFADPDDEYTGNLIQTIINNNFNFELRTDGSTQSEIYSVSSRTSSDGWDE